MCAFEVNHLDGLTSLTKQLLSFSSPSSTVLSPRDDHLQLHFISQKIISLLIQYETFGKTVCLKRDSETPRKSHKVISEIYLAMLHLALADCGLYTSSPDRKPASRRNSLHARHKKAVNQIHPDNWGTAWMNKSLSENWHFGKGQERVTSLSARLITHPEQRWAALGYVTRLLQKHVNGSLPLTQMPAYSPHPLLHSQFPESSPTPASLPCLHSFTLLSHGKREGFSNSKISF